MLGINVDRTLDVTTSVLASTLMGWKGSFGSRRVALPVQTIEIYDREGCARCRLVREALTELNLDVNIIPVPMGASRFKDQLKQVSGQARVPYMVDQNSGQKRGGSTDIIEYLYKTYGNKPMPAHLKSNSYTLMRSKAATMIRAAKGLEAVASKSAQSPLTLYSFESSPYSRIVRECLCELELPYTLVNIGKQQWADVGPSNFRMHLGEYKPIPNTKRSEFLAKHGNVQVPYLIDPNTGVDLFESAEILDYLNRTYAMKETDY